MWNGSHEWASFKFQGAGRLTGRFDFDLPDMIGRKRDHLSGSRVKDRSLGLGEIGELPFRKNGKPAGRFYYRFLYGYRP
jgi:hypothetical protein